MDLHLVDATYELFRAHFSPRPPVRGRDGTILSGVAGLVEQLLLLLREWYMHPNGQLPAYEWTFDDVNPPVHAWAVLQVFHGSHEIGRAHV